MQLPQMHAVEAEAVDGDLGALVFSPPLLSSSPGSAYPEGLHLTAELVLEPLSPVLVFTL